MEMERRVKLSKLAGGGEGTWLSTVNKTAAIPAACNINFITINNTDSVPCTCTAAISHNTWSHHMKTYSSVLGPYIFLLDTEVWGGVLML